FVLASVGFFSLLSFPTRRSSDLKAGRLEWTVGMCLFLPTFQQSNLQTRDPWPSLDRATASFDTVRTLTADFVQIVENPMLGDPEDRKSTRLNSSHEWISYAVFCL